MRPAAERPRSPRRPSQPSRRRRRAHGGRQGGPGRGGGRTGRGRYRRPRGRPAPPPTPVGQRARARGRVTLGRPGLALAPGRRAAVGPRPPARSSRAPHRDGPRPPAARAKPHSSSAGSRAATGLRSRAARRAACGGGGPGMAVRPGAIRPRSRRRPAFLGRARELSLGVLYSWAMDCQATCSVRQPKT